jgi:hypothetical protein
MMICRFREATLYGFSSVTFWKKNIIHHSAILVFFGQDKRPYAMQTLTLPLQLATLVA